MTNGEKFKKIFKISPVQVDEGELYAYVWLPTHDAIEIPLEWWNAEYKEPTTKNDLGVDAISREQALVAIRNLYPGMPRVDFNGSLRKWVDKYKPYIECDDAIKHLPPATPQEPTDKNFTKADIDAIAKALNEGWELRVNEILDKLRAEIRSYSIYVMPQYGRTIREADVLHIIDKYKAESEDKDG